MQTVKNNPTPLATTMVLAPADLLRHAIQSAGATQTAALQLVYSAALYLLSVSHFADAKDDKVYRPKSKAVEYMEAEIAKATGVKNRMLANYVTAASYLFDTLAGNKTRFGSVLDKIAAAKTIDAGITVLSSWYETAKGTRIDSMRMFLETMGHREKAAPRGATKPTAESVIKRVQNTVTQIEKNFVQPDKGKAVVTERQVAAAIVSKVSNKLTLLIEALNALTQEAELDALEAAIEKRRKDLLAIQKDLSDKAAKAVKEAAKTSKTVNVPGSRTRKVNKTGRNVHSQAA